MGQTKARCLAGGPGGLDTKQISLGTEKMLDKSLVKETLALKENTFPYFVLVRYCTVSNYLEMMKNYITKNLSPEFICYKIWNDRFQRKNRDHFTVIYNENTSQIL